MLQDGLLKVMFREKHTDGDPTPRSLRPVTGTALSLLGNMTLNASFDVRTHAIKFVML